MKAVFTKKGARKPAKKKKRCPVVETVGQELIKKKRRRRNPRILEHIGLSHCCPEKSESRKKKMPNAQIKIATTKRNY